MTRTRIASAAAACSALLLCGAFIFQALGYPPCKLCLWQRWPHVIAVACGFGYIWLHKRPFLWAGAAATLTTAAIGLYHVGVEQTWWEGPSSCSSGGVGGLSVDELLEQILAAPVVRCDEIAWQFIGISMAGWNAIFSLALAACWFGAGVSRRRIV